MRYYNDRNKSSYPGQPQSFGVVPQIQQTREPGKTILKHENNHYHLILLGLYSFHLCPMPSQVVPTNLLDHIQVSLVHFVVSKQHRTRSHIVVSSRAIVPVLKRQCNPPPRRRRLRCRCLRMISKVEWIRFYCHFLLKIPNEGQLAKPHLYILPQ